MIMILTSESGDYSHQKVIDWLRYKKCNNIILTKETLITGNQKML